METRKLNKTDVYRAVRFLPKVVRDVIKQHGLAVAGGYLRATVQGEVASDIDLFAPNAKVAEAAKNQLHTEWRLKSYKTRWSASANAMTVANDDTGCCVQFITRWVYSTPADIIASFDFTMCQAALWWDASTLKWQTMCCDRFYEDIAAKRLIYTCPQRNEDAGGSLMRVRKFLARGWHIDAEQLGKVIARLMNGIEISEYMTKTPSDEREAWFAKVITGLLREVDPNTRIAGLEDLDGMVEAEAESLREAFFEVENSDR